MRFPKEKFPAVFFGSILFLLTMSPATVAVGDPDPSFSASDGRSLTRFGNFGDVARKVLIQPDGKIILVGKGTATHSFGDFVLVRYNSDGSLDNSFDDDGKVLTVIGIQSSNARAAVLQPDGKIIVAGEAWESSSSLSDFAIIRYNTDGSLDLTFGNAGKVFTSFNSGSQDYPQDVALQPDGKIVVSGNTSAGGFAVARYHSDGSLDASFGVGGKVAIAIANQGNNNNAILVQPDGKIVLAGSLTISNPPETQYRIGLVRLDPNGVLDPTFDGDGKVTTEFGLYAICNDIQLQPDGKIVAVGGANVNGGTGLDFAAVRYNPDGSLDGQFGSGGKVSTSLGASDDSAWAAILEPDGNLVLGGEARHSIDDTDFSLVRYHTNGDLDTEFGVDGKVLTAIAAVDPAYSLALQPDGKLVAAGSAAAASSSSLMAAVRYDQNGMIDPEFGFRFPGRTNIVVRGMIDEANAVAVQADGRILLAGRSRITNRYSFSLARQNPDGSLDPTFGANGVLTTKIGVGDTDGEARAVALQSDGKIVAAGRLFDANTAQSLYYFAVSRYNSDGSLDTTFDEDGITIISGLNEDSQAHSVAVQSDGKILVAGYADTLPGTSTVPAWSVIRLETDGSLDTTFDGDGIATIDMGNSFDIAYSLQLQPDGKIVIGGVGVGNDGSSDFGLVRLHPDGSLDQAFGTGGKVLTPLGSSNDEIRSILIQPDGKIVAAGIARIGATNDFGVVRYNPDGSLDPTFGSGGKVTTAIVSNAIDNASAAVMQGDGKIIVTGTTTVSNNQNLAIVRYLPTGLLDTSFGANGVVITDYGSVGNTGETATSAALDSDGKLIVVGSMRDRTVNRRDFLTVRYLTKNMSLLDYDGDGRTDFSVFRPSSGAWYLQRSTAGFQGLQFGANGDKLTPADYDGDGKTDIAVYRPAAGQWYVLNSATSTVTYPVFGVAEDVPAPGDYDGDGKADLTVFRPSQGTWYRQNSSNGSFFGFQFGANGDVPTVGDFDGDGKNDLGIWRPSNGDWYNIRSADGSVFGERFGQAGDKIAPADYDGDGKTDIAIFRPSTGLWVVRNSAMATYSYNVFGSPSDVPISGDYDGDGKADIGVWRPSDGTWYVQRSSNGSFLVFPWGQNGDVPTPAAFGN